MCARLRIAQRSQAAESFAREVQSAAQEAQKIAHDVVLYTSARVGAGANFANSLQRMGLDAVTAADVTGSAGSVFNFRRFHAGNLLWIGRSVNGAVRAVKYQIDADRMLLIEAREAGYHAEIQQIPSRVQTLTVTGTVRDSLFGAVTDAGESPELAMRLAEIFGWDLDFYTDPRRGDTFHVVVEKKEYLDGKTAGYGRILAAEYKNAGHPYQAVFVS